MNANVLATDVIKRAKVVKLPSSVMEHMGASVGDAIIFLAGDNECVIFKKGRIVEANE